MSSAERRRQLAHERALARAKKAHRAAGQKLSRLRVKGVNVITLDTRVDSKTIDTMTTRQANAYATRQENFIDRKNGYVAGVKGEPLQTSSVTEYRRIERAYNRITKTYEDQLNNIIVPGTGRTVKQLLDDNKLPNAARANINVRTFQEIHRNMRNIVNQASLRELIKHLATKTTNDYIAKEAGVMRNTIKQMTDTTGDTAIWDRVKNLTDNQLNILVDYAPGFMRALAYRYEVAKSNSDLNNLRSDIAAGYEDAGDSLHEFIDWAAKLPANYRPSRT